MQIKEEYTSQGFGIIDAFLRTSPIWCSLSTNGYICISRFRALGRLEDPPG